MTDEERIKHHIMFIRMGAQICVWCGTPIVPLFSNIDHGIDITSLEPWIPHSQDTKVHEKCYQPIKNLVMRRCMEYLSEMQARTQRT